jgi:hypothetical protein
VIERTQKESVREATTNVAEIFQNRTADKGQFFKRFSVAQIKKYSTNESLDVT